MIGFEGGRPAHDVAAARGRVPEVPLAAAEREHRASPRSRRRRSSRPSSAWRSSRSATPRCGCRSPPTGVVLEAGGSRRRAGLASRSSARWEGRATIVRSRSTRSTCSTASARSTATRTTLSFTGPTRPAVLTGKRDADGEAAAAPTTATCSCRCACPAEPAAGRAPGAAGTGTHATSTTERRTWRVGMVGLGRMGGNMAERLRRGGHEVVGYDRAARSVADVDSLEELVAGAADAPRVVWVMVPGRRADLRDGGRARPSCSSRATSSSTAATRATPTTSGTPPTRAEAASASSTSGLAAASGA